MNSPLQKPTLFNILLRETQLFFSGGLPPDHAEPPQRVAAEHLHDAAADAAGERQHREEADEQGEEPR